MPVSGAFPAIARRMAHCNCGKLCPEFPQFAVSAFFTVPKESGICNNAGSAPQRLFSRASLTMSSGVHEDGPRLSAGHRRCRFVCQAYRFHCLWSCFGDGFATSARRVANYATNTCGGNSQKGHNPQTLLLDNDYGSLLFYAFGFEELAGPWYI